MVVRRIVAVCALVILAVSCSAQTIDRFQGTWVTDAYKKPEDLSGRTFLAIQKLSDSRCFVISYSTFYPALSFAGYGTIDSLGRISVLTSENKRLIFYFSNSRSEKEKPLLILYFPDLEESYPFGNVSDLLK
jgi:hypothetical protein